MLQKKKSLRAEVFPLCEVMNRELRQFRFTFFLRSLPKGRPTGRRSKGGVFFWTCLIFCSMHYMQGGRGSHIYACTFDFCTITFCTLVKLVLGMK